MDEYERVGGVIIEDLLFVSLIIGVKVVLIDLFILNKIYVFFLYMIKV